MKEGKFSGASAGGVADTAAGSPTGGTDSSSKQKTNTGDPTGPTAKRRKPAAANAAAAAGAAASAAADGSESRLSERTSSTYPQVPLCGNCVMMCTCIIPYPLSEGGNKATRQTPAPLRAAGSGGACVGGTLVLPTSTLPYVSACAPCPWGGGCLLRVREMWRTSHGCRGLIHGAIGQSCVATPYKSHIR